MNNKDIIGWIFSHPCNDYLIIWSFSPPYFNFPPLFLAAVLRSFGPILILKPRGGRHRAPPHPAAVWSEAWRGPPRVEGARRLSRVTRSESLALMARNAHRRTRARRLNEVRGDQSSGLCVCPASVASWHHPAFIILKGRAAVLILTHVTCASWARRTPSNNPSRTHGVAASARRLTGRPTVAVAARFRRCERSEAAASSIQRSSLGGKPIWGLTRFGGQINSSAL